jgi:hypothetical protein
VRCRPLDQRGANPTAATARTRPRCQWADTSPCPLLTGEGSPRCPRFVRRRRGIWRRGSRPHRQRRGEPLSCKERGRGEVSAPGPAERKPNRSRRDRRALSGKRPTPLPALSLQERVPRAVRASFLPRGEKEGASRLRTNLSPPSPHPPYSPRPSPKRGGHPEVCQWLGDGSAPAGGVTIHSREASGHRPGGTTAPVRGARWNGRIASRLRPMPDGATTR